MTSTHRQPLDGQVRVTMYRVGLGDCFLLSFPRTNDKPFHTLIDCGGVNTGPEGAARLREVAADIRDTTGGILHLLVITHDHWDHLSGFVYAYDEIFKRLTIEQVCFGWTEDPDNLVAQDLAIAARGRRRHLWEMVRQMRTLGLDHRAQHLRDLLGFYGAEGDDVDTDDEPTTRASTMRWLKRCGRKPPRYCQPGQLMEFPQLPQVRFYVLGPPLDDETVHQKAGFELGRFHLSQLSLQRPGEEALFSALRSLTSQGDSTDVHRPFDQGTGRRESTWILKDRYESSDDRWRRIDHAWMGSAEQLALDLDSHTNNTSLVLAIEMVDDGRVLLFPGDANMASWTCWHESAHCWPRGSDGREVDVRSLLQRTVLYKVAHHGSGHATAMELGFELMGQSQRLVAMVPTHESWAQERYGWRMPSRALMSALVIAAEGRVLRSDADFPQKKVVGGKPPWVPGRRWQQHLARVDVNELFIDYFA